MSVCHVLELGQTYGNTTTMLLDIEQSELSSCLEIEGSGPSDCMREV